VLFSFSLPAFCLLLRTKIPYWSLLLRLFGLGFAHDFRTIFAYPFSFVITQYMKRRAGHTCMMHKEDLDIRTHYALCIRWLDESMKDDIVDATYTVAALLHIGIYHHR
jgi:hypothetical protein